MHRGAVRVADKDLPETNQQVAVDIAAAGVVTAAVADLAADIVVEAIVAVMASLNRITTKVAVEVISKKEAGHQNVAEEISAIRMTGNNILY